MISPWRRLGWQRLLRRRRAAAQMLGTESPLRAVLDCDLPELHTSVLEVPLLAIDLELTGLDVVRDDIVSFGWVPIDAGAIDLSGAGHVLVHRADGRSVGESATVHGIRDCDRAPGVRLADALAEMFRALPGRLPVFHYAALDAGVLQRACRKVWGQGWPTPSIDTLAWYRRRQLRRGAHVAPPALRLDVLHGAMGLGRRTSHDALADALSCAEVLLVLARHSGARVGDVVQLQ